KRETGDPMGLRRWIYVANAKNKKEEYKGFYEDVQGKNLLPFKVLTPEESKAKAPELGDNAGWIHVYSFSSSGGQQNKKDNPPKKDKDATAKPNDAQKKDQKQGQYQAEMTASTRNLKGVKRSASLKAVRRGLMQANHIKDRKNAKGLAVIRREGGLIMHELEPVEDVTIT